MKKVSLLLLALIISGLSFGQLTGTKTIPGDYATIEAAITALNAQGVGAGGVVFNVAAGHTETTTSVLQITATGTVANPITFQKNGIGANPLITRTDAGTNVTATLGGIGDAIIQLSGTDNITFDGISLAASNSGIEYGYYTFKPSGTDGCQNVTIKNATITMTKGTSGYVIGIYISNGPTALNSATGVTVTSADGKNMNITITGNTIQNVHSTIYTRGSTAMYDENYTIGQAGAGNTLQNFGGGSASTTYGVYFIYVNNPSVSYNIIDNAGGGGSPHGSTLYGVFYSTVTGVVVGSNNTITMSNSSTSSATQGIYNANTVTSSTFDNNVFSTGTVSSTGSFYFIYASSATPLVSVSGNQTTGTINRTGTSGTVYCYYNNGSPTSGTETIINNNFSNITVAGSTTLYGIRTNTATGQNRLCSGNIISNWIGGTGAAYPLYLLSSGTNQIENNVVSDIAVGGTVYGLYFTGTNPSVTGNTVRTITTAGATCYAIYNAGTGNTDCYKNEVFDITSTNTSCTLRGIYITTGTTNNVYNNFINDLKAPSSGSSTSVAGIYVSGGTSIGLYYNTIYLNATSSGSNFGSAAIYASTSPTVEIRNNILVNNSIPNGTGFTIAYWRSSTSLGSYATTSNNNDFYAGTPGPANLIFYDGTNALETLAAYQAFVSPIDAASFTSLPPFINIAMTPYDLHLQTGISTKCESGGSTVSTPGITTDYDGQPRYPNPGYPNDPSNPATAPDVGADEFAGIPSFSCAAPVPGATLSTANQLCLNQEITLSLENAVPGTGVSYKWQSSPDGVTYTDIPGANALLYTYTPTASLYYQCVVTCQNGPVSATSTPLQVSFLNSILTTTPGTRCGTGTVDLTASGSPGTTLNWYNAAIGGNWIGTGSPFTTPIISSTTTYYVGAENFAPGTVPVGAGATTSSTYSNPFYSAWSNIHTQHLIPATELTAAGLGAGNITSVALDVTNPYTLPMIDLSLKIGTTTATNMSAFVSPAFTEVFTSASYMPATGLNVLTFSTPFYWDGTSNIVLEFCHGNGSSTATMSRIVKADATSYVSTIKTNISAATPAATICANTTTNLVTYSVRPQFTFGGQIVCSSPRIPVVATVTPPPALTLTANQTVCNNTVATINVTSTLADFDTYTWAPQTNLFTDMACTIPYIAGVNASTVYAKSTTSSIITYTCTGTNNTSLCANTATSEVTVLPGTVTILSTPESICVTGTPTLDATPATGYGTATLQWQDSPDGITFTDIPGATSASYTPGAPLTVTRYYKLLVNIGPALCTQSNMLMVPVYDPQITGTTPGSRCGIGTVTLGATTGAGNTLNWYDAPSGGTLVGTGSSFLTPVINTTTDYYVSSSAGSSTTGSVGVPSNGATGTYTLEAGLLFDVIATNVLIDGVHIYPVGTGDGFVNIALKNSAGTTLETTSFACTGTPTPGIKTFVPLNWTVATGTGYFLDMTSRTGSVTSLVRDGTSDIIGGPIATNAYCTLPGVLTITSGRLGSTGTSTSYYYFYDWVVSTGCQSPRIQVTATVTPAPPFSVTGNQTVCNNAPAMITVTSTLADFDTYVWTPATNLFTDAAGTVPYVPGASAATVYAKSTTAGITNYTCTAENTTSMCVNIATSEVTILPASPPITPAPATICVSGSTTLTPTPSTGYGTATFQWQDSPDGITYTDIPGATTITYTTPTLTSTTYYKLIISLNGIPCTESTVTAQVNDPQVTSTFPGNRCGTGTVSLAAFTGAGYQLNWYDAPTGGNQLGTGFLFTTPVISTTTDYYVSASAGSGTTGSVGPVDNTFGAGAAFAYSYYMIFDVLAPVMNLVGVYVYPGAAGDVILYIADNTGTQLHTVTHPVTAGDVGVKTYIPIGFELAAGTNYRIGYLTTLGGVALFRNEAGASYPYTLTDVVSITGNNFNPVYYYYVYDWQVRTGCESGRTAVTATVTPAPPVVANAVPTTICEGSSSTLSASSTNDPNYTYTWTPATTPPTGASVSASPSATTTYTVQANDNTAGPYSGCQAFANVTVNVDPMPSAITITPPSAGINPGDIQMLTAGGGLLPNAPILSENFNTGAPGWTIENGATSPAPAAWHYEAAPYNGGCCTFTNFTTQDGGLFAYSDSDAGGTGTTNDTRLISPSFSTLGFSAVSLTFEHVYSKFSADVTVALEISTNGGTTWTVLRDYLALGSQGTTTPGSQATTNATIDLSAYVNQADVKIRFNYSSGWGYYWIVDNVRIAGTGPTLTSFTWAPFTDLFTDAAATIPYAGTVTPTVYSKPVAPITYTVTATSPSQCTTTKDVTISFLPVPTITGTGTVCAGTRGEIYTTETGMTNYTWTVSAGGTIVGGGGAADNTVTIDWMTAGAQSVSVNYTDTYGYQAATATVKPVTVNPLPAADAGANRTICSGESTQIGATAVAGNTHSWTSLPAGFTSTAADPTVSPLVTTEYILVETVTATGCTNSHSVIVTVNPIPAAVAGADRAICYGETTQIGAAAVAGNTYSWTSVPAGYTSTLANPVVRPLVTTTYTLIETITATGCTNTHSVVVTVNPIPDANAGANRAICKGTSTQLGADPVAGSTYFWTSLPIGFTSTQANPTVTPQTNTIYTLVETITATGCSNSNSVLVTVNPLPAAVAGADRAICLGESTQLGASAVTGNTYSWTSVPAGFTSAVSNPTVSPLVTTTYTLVETVSATGCTNSHSVVVTVDPLPAAVAGADRAICEGESTQLGASAVAGNTYSWTSVPAGFTSAVADPTVSPLVTTTYTLMETITATGCTNSNSVVVTVNPLPAAIAGADRTICEGVSTQLGASAVAGNTYSWTSVPAGFTSAVANPTVSPLVNTTYTLVETVTATGCTNSHSVVVSVDPLPAAAGAITGPSSVVQGQTGVTYTVPAIANATGYTWTLPAGASITSGGNSNSIVVSFSASASSGVFSVYGTNLCGNGATSPDFAVTVTSAVPTNLTVAETVHVGEVKCYNALQTITVAGSGNTFTVETGGDATFIAGQNIRFLPGTTVQPGGHLWAYITTTGSYCGTLAPSIVTVSTEELSLPGANRTFFKVYPNPTNGKFTLELTHVDTESEVYVEIYTMRGESMVKETLIGETKHEFTLEGNPSGIYIMRILNKEMAGTAKIIKN